MILSLARREESGRAVMVTFSAVGMWYSPYSFSPRRSINR